MRVLIAEPDPNRLDAMRQAASDVDGLELICCDSAADALEIAEDTAINCFILDEDLPVLSGHCMCRLLRHIPHYLQTPIFITSSAPTRGQSNRAVRAEATMYLAKDKVGDLFQSLDDTAMIDIDDATFLDQGFVESDRTEETAAELQPRITRRAMANFLCSLTSHDRHASVLFSLQVRNGQLVQNMEGRPVLRSIEAAIESVAVPGSVLYSHVGYGCFIVLADANQIGSEKKFGARVERELRLDPDVEVGLCPLTISAPIHMGWLTSGSANAAFARLTNNKHRLWTDEDQPTPEPLAAPAAMVAPSTSTEVAVAA